MDAAARPRAAATAAALAIAVGVFATAFAALFLGEPAGGRRLAGAAVVVAGITVLALA